MAWRHRHSGRSYYYRPRRAGRQVRNEYMGHGFLGDLAAAMDGKEQHQRAMQRLAFRRFVQEQRRVDRAIDAYGNAVRELVAEALQKLGFHQHKRQWRMKRAVEKGNMADTALTQQAAQALDEYNRLHRAANVEKPKKEDVERLRQFAVANPAIFDVYPMLAHTTLEDVIETATPSEVTRIYITGEAKSMRRSLGYKTATPLEKPLIENVVLAWVRLQFFEQTYTAKYKEGVSLAHAAYLENRLSASQRRYLRAIESLARVRGLLARAGVQINMAQQMVVQNG